MSIRGAILALTAAASLAGCATAPGPPPPGEAESYANFLIGRVANRRGDYQAAADRYYHALTSAPRDADLLEGALMASLASGDLDRARELARVEPVGGEVSTYARMVRAGDLINAGRYRQARDQLDQIQGDAAQELTARLLLTWARTGEGRVDEVIMELERLSSMRPYGALFAYQQAMALDYAGRTDAALAAYAQASDGSLWLASAVERRADLMARTGDRENAAAALRSGGAQPDSEALTRALARLEAGQSPSEAPLTPARGAAVGLYGLGAIFQQENDVSRGLLTLSLALMLDPRLDAARLSFAEGQSELDHQDQALEALAGVPASSPYHESARVMQAWVLKDQGREDEALAFANATAQSGTPRAQRALADLYRALDRYDEAEPIYTQLIAADQRNWRLYFARGATRAKLGRHDDAEADMQRALALSPDQPDVLNYLGYMWIDRGEHLQEGLAMIQHAVELRPLSGAIIDSLGWAYYRMGDYEHALEHLERAVELEPADPTLNDHLGDLYWRLDRRTEARFQWRRALTLEPDDAVAIETKIDRGLPALRSAAR